MLYALRKLFKEWFGTYTVAALSVEGDGWSAFHRAWTEAEALEWMRAYPRWASIIVVKRYWLKPSTYSGSHVVAARFAD
jgi:hypothetical protein